MQQRVKIIGTSSLLALGLVVAGGYVVNAATASSTTITACSHQKTGVVRVVAPSAKCKSSEKRLTWNVKGATGARGLTGLTGPAGPRGSDGQDGAPGADGVAGQNGAEGADGQDGVDGVDGQDGAPGPAGPAGPAGGTAEVDPNPNDLTYRMQIGNDPAMRITGFTQKLSQSGSMQAGDGAGAGKASFGDIVATLPMNSLVLNQMGQLAKGTHAPAAQLEMCKPGELSADPRVKQPLGQCSLVLSLSEVLVTGVEVQQDPAQATVTVRLNVAREKVSVVPGTAQAASYEWDIAENTAASSSGSTLSTSTGDTTYTTTLTGSGGQPRGVLSTRSWSQGATSSGTTQMGGGGGAGKASFSDVLAETRTGNGTLALLRALATGEVLSRVDLAGCESTTCATTLRLNDVLVTELVLGSPTLFDRVRLNYAQIDWTRNDDVAHGAGQNRSFRWDVLNNIGY